MADESDRNILTGLLRTGLTISLGAASTGLDMALNPPKAVSKVMSEVQSMLTVPDTAGPEPQDKAKALAAVWLEKGANLLSEFHTAGEKFTKGK